MADRAQRKGPPRRDSETGASGNVNSNGGQPLSRRDRLRRVVLLCCSFGRNVAFYRAGWTAQAQPLLSEHHPDASFWRQVNANFLDIAVLEWCKLFGDQKDTPPQRIGKHHWRRVVSDPAAFEQGLLACLKLESDDFAKLITRMRQYRDEYVAHLDDGKMMQIPELDEACEAVGYYHRHIVEREAQPGDLVRLPLVRGFARGHHQCVEEAERIYAAHIYSLT